MEKEKREELERIETAKNKLFENFPELNPSRLKGTFLM